jgi:hypothetical protein
MRHRLGFCLAPAVFCLLDAGLTLHGQPAAYWAGQFGQAVEANPPFLWLLRLHPLGFAAGVLGWLGVLVSLVLLLPEGVVRALAFVALFAHTLGAGSWLVHAGGSGWLACVGLLVLARLVSGVTTTAADATRRSPVRSRFKPPPGGHARTPKSRSRGS